MSDGFKKKAEVYEQPMWEVYDPWQAKIVGYFFTERDAKLFRKAYDKRRNRDAG